MRLTSKSAPGMYLQAARSSYIDFDKLILGGFNIDFISTKENDNSSPKEKAPENCSKFQKPDMHHRKVWTVDWLDFYKCATQDYSSPTIIEFLSFKTFNKDEFVKDLNNVPWHIVFNTLSDVNCKSIDMGFNLQFSVSIGNKLAECFLRALKNNLNDILPNCTSTITLKAISKDFVIESIKQLKTNKASALNKINARMLRLAFDFIAPSYTQLFNLFIETRFFPQQFGRPTLFVLYVSCSCP